MRLARHYLAKYRHIILWGTGINPENVKFDAIYTDLTWKERKDQKQKVLTHYTDMLRKV